MNDSEFYNMGNSEYEYILAANKTAMILYKQSKKILMASNNYDFMVFKFSKWEEVLKNGKTIFL